MNRPEPQMSKLGLYELASFNKQLDTMLHIQRPILHIQGNWATGLIVTDEADGVTRVPAKKTITSRNVDSRDPHTT